MEPLPLFSINVVEGVVLGGLGRLAGSIGAKLWLAFLRSLRTLLQGIAGAFPAAGVGTSILGSSYWLTFGYSVLAALIAAAVSFLQNVASFLPEDPTQKAPVG
jgi:hypothetical protein